MCNGVVEMLKIWRMCFYKEVANLESSLVRTLNKTAHIATKKQAHSMQLWNIVQNANLHGTVEDLYDETIVRACYER